MEAGGDEDDDDALPEPRPLLLLLLLSPRADRDFPKKNQKAEARIKRVSR